MQLIFIQFFRVNMPSKILSVLIVAEAQIIIIDFDQECFHYSFLFIFK